MKKAKLIALLAVIITVSCNKKLDVPLQNSTDKIETADDVKALLFGNYQLYQNANAFGERFQLIADLLASSEQVDWVGSFTPYKDIQFKEQLADNSIATSMWENTYQLILSTNTVLDKISLISDDEKDLITGEAKFLRGVAYLELVNFYAQPYSAGNITAQQSGVPIVLQPVYLYDSLNNKPSRATVDEVYKQVISDLTDAVAKLPAPSAARTQERADKNAAKAMLARVYMNMADYTNAAQMANDVIASGKYKLNASFDAAFNNASYSSEDIFSIAQTNQSNAGTSDNGLATFYSPQPDSGVGRGDAQINADYFSYFEDEDTRAKFITAGTSIGGYDGNYTKKWWKFYKYIPVIRLAEMYLTRGEANLRKGGAPTGGVSALDDINTVRERAGASALGTVAAGDFVEERFRELGFEGDRLWTLKRLKMEIDGVAFNDDKLILPIPQREMDVNKNLKQNNGY